MSPDCPVQLDRTLYPIRNIRIIFVSTISASFLLLLLLLDNRLATSAISILSVPFGYFIAAVESAALASILFFSLLLLLMLWLCYSTISCYSSCYCSVLCCVNISRLKATTTTKTTTTVLELISLSLSLSLMASFWFMLPCLSQTQLELTLPLFSSVVILIIIVTVVTFMTTMSIRVLLSNKHKFALTKEFRFDGDCGGASTLSTDASGCSGLNSIYSTVSNIFTSDLSKHFYKSTESSKLVDIILSVCRTIYFVITSTNLPRPSRNISKSKSSTVFFFRFLFAISILASLNVANCLKITHYSIPRMVNAANATSATLDCVYTYDPGDVKLVVRWFHNDSPEPIYQWIPEADIRYVGELIRPYFDMDFKVSTDRYSKYRALRLVRANHRPLPVDLSGNFSCVISSIANQDSRQGQMVVFVPPMKFEFHFVELTVEQIGLECRARDVYPKPVLTFSEQFSSNHSYYHRFPSINVSISYQPESSFYSASFLHPISSILRAGTVYECRLELPGTNYIRKKRIKIIFPTNYSFKPGRIDKSFSLSVSSSSSIVNMSQFVVVLVNIVLFFLPKLLF